MQSLDQNRREVPEREPVEQIAAHAPVLLAHLAREFLVRGIIHPDEVRLLENKFAGLTTFPYDLVHIWKLVPERWNSDKPHPIRLACVNCRTPSLVAEVLHATTDMPDSQFMALWGFLAAKEFSPEWRKKEATAAELVSRYRRVVEEGSAHVDFRKIDPADFEKVETILEYSKYPAEDLGLLAVRPKLLDGSVTAARLTKFYSAGNHWILDPRQVSEQKLPLEFKRWELPLLTALAHFEPRPSRSERTAFIRNAQGLTSDIKDNFLLGMVTAACNANTPFTDLRVIVALWRTRKSPDDVRIAKAFADPALEAKYFAPVLKRVKELTTARDPLLRSVGATYASDGAGRFAERILNDGFRPSSTSIDLDLNEVRRRFLNGDCDLRVPAPVDQVNRAVDQLETILRMGEEFLTPDLVVLEDRMKLLKGSLDPANPEWRCKFFALTREIFFRCQGFYPYHMQTVTALLVADMFLEAKADDGKGCLIEVKTGEGKTPHAALITAYCRTLGMSVDVLSTDLELAGRDASSLETFYQCVGSTVGCFDARKLETFEPDILYSTGEHVGFARLTEALHGVPPFSIARDEVGIFDEADEPTLDGALTDLKIGIKSEHVIPVPVMKRAFELIKKLGKNSSWEDRQARITQLRIDDKEAEACDHASLCLFAESAVQSLKMLEGRDYFEKKGHIIYVDWKASGRDKPSVQLAHGLHECLYLKHGLTPPAGNATAAQISNAQLIRRYPWRIMFTGTAGEDLERKEVVEHFKLKTFDVPTVRPRRREDTGITVVETESEWIRYIVESATGFQREFPNRPQLVLTHRMDHTDLVRKALFKSGIASQCLDGLRNLDTKGKKQREPFIIDEAGAPGKVTVFTAVGARGTDYQPSEPAIEAGGFYFLQTYESESERYAEQAKGRVARKGNPGTVHKIICLQTDPFLEGLPPEGRAFFRAIALDSSGPHRLEAAISFLRSCSVTCDIDRRRVARAKADVSYKVMTSFFDQRNGVLSDCTDLAREVAARSTLNRRWARYFNTFLDRLEYRRFEVSPSLIHDDSSLFLSHLARCFPDADGLVGDLGSKVAEAFAAQRARLRSEFSVYAGDNGEILVGKAMREYQLVFETPALAG